MGQLFQIISALQASNQDGDARAQLDPHALRNLDVRQLPFFLNDLRPSFSPGNARLFADSETLVGPNQTNLRGIRGSPYIPHPTWPSS